MKIIEEIFEEVNQQIKDQAPYAMRKYRKINSTIRNQLIKKIYEEKMSIKKAAKEVNINYSSAKTILNQYKKKGIASITEGQQQELNQCDDKKILQKQSDDLHMSRRNSFSSSTECCEKMNLQKKQMENLDSSEEQSIGQKQIQKSESQSSLASSIMDYCSKGNESKKQNSKCSRKRINLNLNNLNTFQAKEAPVLKDISINEKQVLNVRDEYQKIMGQIQQNQIKKQQSEQVQQQQYQQQSKQKQFDNMNSLQEQFQQQIKSQQQQGQIETQLKLFQQQLLIQQANAQWQQQQMQTKMMEMWMVMQQQNNTQQQLFMQQPQFQQQIQQQQQMQMLSNLQQQQQQQQQLNQFQQQQQQFKFM